MNLNNKRRKYVKIYRETGSDKIFALLDEVDSDLEDDIDNLMNNSDSEFVGNLNSGKSLENYLDFDDKPLNLLVIEAIYQVVENTAIEETLEEGSSKADKKVKEKQKEKKKGKGEGKYKRKKRKKRNQIW